MVNRHVLDQRDLKLVTLEWLGPARANVDPVGDAEQVNAQLEPLHTAVVAHIGREEQSMHAKTQREREDDFIDCQWRRLFASERFAAHRAKHRRHALLCQWPEAVCPIEPVP
eukprot:3349241-Pleurochrysis_carterae.AAC.1